MEPEVVVVCAHFLLLAQDSVGAEERPQKNCVLEYQNYHSNCNVYLKVVTQKVVANARQNNITPKEPKDQEDDSVVDALTELHWGLFALELGQLYGNSMVSPYKQLVTQKVEQTTQFAKGNKERIVIKVSKLKVNVHDRKGN